jgi:SAM-dependent methyltransferase
MNATTGTAPPLAARATADEVRACYRILLGREPESEEVVARHLARELTLAQLRESFIRSKEFLARNRVPVQAMPLAPAPIPVESEATPEQLAAMLERTGGYWERIGGQAPHWSVLTQERFKPSHIEANHEEFYATGENDRALVRDLLARHGLSPSGLPRLVEFGCGVGRATLALAQDFAEVTGCDISPGHLALAEEMAGRRGIRNIAWHRSVVRQPMPEGQWDLWFSRIVLQHNPPPVIAWLLRIAFAGLAPGGVAIFQVPTHCVGYRFGVEAHLARQGEPGMEMHVLPQAAVFALAAEAGLSVLELREDTHVVSSNTTAWLSNMFVLRRPPG